MQFSKNKKINRVTRINAMIRYVEGDFTDPEYKDWSENFDENEIPPVLTLEEKTAFMKTLKGVGISSDAFFPFRDNIDQASKRGVQYVAQPGGSVADENVIKACEEYGMSMVFTSVRLFQH
jgi:phosphoribosylaminoimidazolecarboxamide formyltransferase/IMP cyclohydrolase